jgi:hypothetical protein
MFQSLCGDKVLSNVMLTTTHWDVVDQTRAVERETELQSTFWKGMTERGAKVKRCDGSRDSAWKVVEPLLSLDRIVLNIQKQIELGMTVSDTDAGQVVNEELLNARKKFEEELDALKTEWKAASDEKDVEMARILEEERKHAEGKLQQVKAEQEEFMRVQIEEMKRKNEELQRKIDEAHSSGGWFPRLAKAFVGGLATLVGVPAPLAIGLASAI